MQSILESDPPLNGRNSIIGEDDGHVILAPSLQRPIDKASALLFRPPATAQDIGDTIVGERIGQPVGAQHQPVAVFERVAVDDDLGRARPSTNGIGQDVTQILAACFQRLRIRAVGHSLFDRVIDSQLRQLPVAEVGTRASARRAR